MVNIKDKKFIYNGNTFKFKTINIKLSRDITRLDRKAQEYVKENTIQTEMNVKKYDKDKTSAEYKYWNGKLEIDKTYYLNDYYLIPENIQEYLKTTLEGNIESINIEELKWDELTKFFNFIKELQEFFFPKDKKKELK
jgi:hypothetical protein